MSYVFLRIVVPNIHLMDFIISKLPRRLYLMVRWQIARMIIPRKVDDKDEFSYASCPDALFAPSTSH